MARRPRIVRGPQLAAGRAGGIGVRGAAVGVLAAAGFVGWVAGPAAARPAAPRAAAASVKARVSLRAPSSIASGARLKFSGSSSYTSGSRERLEVFAAKRATCGRSATVPKGADVIYDTTVDNYASFKIFSDPLSKPGHWELCAYLSVHDKVTAHASAGFRVR